jgi:hypothetical protein
MRISNSHCGAAKLREKKRAAIGPTCWEKSSEPRSDKRDNCKLAPCLPFM